jgi:hypothetical protein
MQQKTLFLERPTTIDEYYYKAYKESYLYFQDWLFLTKALNMAISDLEVNPTEKLAQALFSKLVYDLDVFHKTLVDPNLDDSLINITTVSSLSRIVLENCCTMFYLFLEQVSEEENNFRLLLYEYHGHCQRNRVVEKMKACANNQMQDETEDLIIARKALISKQNELKENLRNNVFFKSLNLKNSVKEKFLKGKCCMYLELDEIFFKLDPNFEKAYSLFMYHSAHVHSHKFSLDQIMEQQHGFANNLDTLITAINVNQMVVNVTLKGFINYFGNRLDLGNITYGFNQLGLAPKVNFPFWQIESFLQYLINLIRVVI